MFAATNVSSAPKYVHLQCSGLSCSYDCWVKYKEKLPCVSDPNQNIDTICNSKRKFTLKRCIKTRQIKAQR